MLIFRSKDGVKEFTLVHERVSTLLNVVHTAHDITVFILVLDHEWTFALWGQRAVSIGPICQLLRMQF